MLRALAARLGLEIVSIGQMQVDLTAVRMIPRELAEKQNLLAVGFADKNLEVVTDDPLNYFAFEEVRQLTGCQVVIRLTANGSAAERNPLLIRRGRCTAGGTDRQRGLCRAQCGDAAGRRGRKRRSRSADRQAAQQPARPCHQHRRKRRCISSRLRGSTRVRMRIDGTIVDYVTLQRSVHQPLIARIKIMANLDIAERRLPQDGHFRIRGDRASTSTSVYRCCRPCSERKAVLRILATAGQVDYASHFGMDDESYAKVPAYAELTERHYLYHRSHRLG